MSGLVMWGVAGLDKDKRWKVKVKVCVCVCVCVHVCCVCSLCLQRDHCPRLVDTYEQLFHLCYENNDDILDTE